MNQSTARPHLREGDVAEKQRSLVNLGGSLLCLYYIFAPQSCKEPAFTQLQPKLCYDAEQNNSSGSNYIYYIEKGLPQTITVVTFISYM